MADQAALELVISAQADRVLVGLSEFERNLARLEGAQHKAAEGAAVHEAAIKKLSGQMELMSAVNEKAILGFEKAKKAAEAFGATFGIIELIKKTVEYDEGVHKLTIALGGNEEAGQRWAATAMRMGLSADDITRSVMFLSTAINTNSPALRDLGIATVDASGKQLDMASVLDNTISALHNNLAATNDLGEAKKLLGRNAQALLPLLALDQAALAGITEEARRYGLILGGDAARATSQAAQAFKEGEFALKAFGIAITNAALPGISLLMQGLTKLISDNLPALTAAISRTVGFIVGFIEALTGSHIEFSKLAQDIGDSTLTMDGLSSSMDSAAQTAKGYAAAEREVSEQAQAATRAINVQIREIEEQDKALSKTINAQIKALQDAQRDDKFADEQTRLKQQASDKQKEIVRLQAEEQYAIWLGDFQKASQIHQQITAAGKSAADIQTKIVEAQQAHQTTIKIDALRKQEADQKDAHQATIDRLRDEVTGIEDAARKNIAAMQDAAQGMSQAISNGLAGMPPKAKDAGNEMGLKLGAAFADAAGPAGVNAGKKMMEALGLHWQQATFGEGRWDEGKWVGDVQWTNIGNAIGGAIADGMATAVGRGMVKWMADTTKRFNDWISDDSQMTSLQFFEKFASSMGSENLFPQHGKAAGGPVGTRPYFVGEHGPELFTPNVPGKITPNGALSTGGSGSDSVQIEIRNHLARVVRLLEAQLSDTGLPGSAAASLRYA